MASFMTMGGAGSTPNIMYGAENNLIGMNSAGNYSQTAVDVITRVTSPSLYLGVITNLKNYKALDSLICNGNIIATKTITPDTNGHPIITLVLASFSNNGRFGASFTQISNYSVASSTICFVANYEPNVDFIQLFNNDKLKIDWDNIVTYEEGSATTVKTIDLAEGLYNIIFVTGANNTSTSHTHTISITNGTIDASDSNAIESEGSTIYLVNAEQGCTVSLNGNTNGSGSAYKAIIVVPYKE